ncbi:hypothetical protein AgCh_032144 [Apium graveolens]
MNRSPKSPGCGYKIGVGVKKPIVVVNHCVAHIEMGRIVTGAKDPVVLYVSGANTQVIAYSEGRYQIFGETIDIAIGTAWIALLESWNCQMIHLQKRRGPGKKVMATEDEVDQYDCGDRGNYFVNQYLNLTGLMPSFQETVFAMLVEITERAMAHCDKKGVLIVGGMGCNGWLQDMMKTMCSKLSYPDSGTGVGHGCRSVRRVHHF